MAPERPLRDPQRGTRSSPLKTLLALALLLSTGCRPAAAPPRARAVERIPLDLEGVGGLSGLAFDPAGGLWAVPERDRRLVRIEGRRTRTIPLEGVPEGTDTESLAWLGPGRIALGTETQEEGRSADRILIAEVGDTARVVDAIELPYALLGIPAETNRGIEGLCVAGGSLVAALETVDDSGGVRRAVIASRPTSGGDWVVRRVRLTSETGKLSGLECRARSGAIQVLAVERHYEVMRIVTFTLGRDEVARVWMDLAGALHDDPNLEGITARDGEVLLVTDNDAGGRSGPSELIRVHRAW